MQISLERAEDIFYGEVIFKKEELLEMLKGETLGGACYATRKRYSWSFKMNAKELIEENHV